MRAYAGVLDPNLWKITRVFPVWTARCPNAVVSPFGPSICDRLGGLLSRLAAFLGPLGSLLGRPRALLSTARCPNVVFSPFGPSIRARRGGLLGRLAAILGPLGSLWGRPRALLSLSDALLELGRLAAFLGPLGSLLGRPRALLSTARCPNVGFSPFGPSIRARLGGLLGRLAAFFGPLGSLLGRPRAL